MSKRISVNAFDMTCVDHQSFGLWRHPRSRATEYNTIEYWTNLAQVLERGRFDALFLADVVGIYDIYRNSAAPSIWNDDVAAPQWKSAGNWRVVIP